MNIGVIKAKFDVTLTRKSFQHETTGAVLNGPGTLEYCASIKVMHSGRDEKLRSDRFMSPKNNVKR